MANDPVGFRLQWFRHHANRSRDSANVLASRLRRGCGGRRGNQRHRCVGRRTRERRWPRRGDRRWQGRYRCRGRGCLAGRRRVWSLDLLGLLLGVRRLRRGHRGCRVWIVRRNLCQLRSAGLDVRVDGLSQLHAFLQRQSLWRGGRMRQNLRSGVRVLHTVVCWQGMRQRRWVRFTVRSGLRLLHPIMWLEALWGRGRLWGYLRSRFGVLHTVVQRQGLWRLGRVRGHV